MKTYKIAGKEYPVLKTVAIMGQTVPLVDIPMMSDYKWLKSCLEDRLKNPELYRTALGEDVEAVIADIRQWLSEEAAV